MDNFQIFVVLICSVVLYLGAVVASIQYRIDLLEKRLGIDEGDK